MNTILNVEILIPIGLLLLQTGIILLIWISILKKIGIIKKPFDGLEYSHAIFTSVFILSVLLVATSSAPAMFQTFKTYQSQNGNLWQLYLYKSSQFFLIILFFEVLLGLVLILFTRTFFAPGNGIKDIVEGSIPSALITSSIVIGFSIALRIMSSEVVEYLRPQYLNFR